MPAKRPFEKVPTIQCANCSTDYAVECPACPYCNWVPLKAGRAKWQRSVLIGVGVMITAGLALAVRLLDASYSIYVFLIGVFITSVVVNRLVGGGEDV